jgi:hypothetical protein
VNQQLTSRAESQDLRLNCVINRNAVGEKPWQACNAGLRIIRRTAPRAVESR